jgi:RimK family alpha-L-glutamate ligase
MKRVVIITEDASWHGDELHAAFAARGCSVSYASLKECRLAFAHGAICVSIPRFERNPPDGIFVRGVPGGTLEQVVQRLNVLNVAHEMGIAVYNDSKAIERTVDKAMTSFLLTKAGIPTPDTWVCESAAQARAVIVRETAACREIVMKPLFGSQGIGLLRVGAGMAVPDLSQFNGVAYLQQFIPNCADCRVLVVNGVAIAQMRRRGLDWINNVARGGRAERIALDDELKALAETAAHAIAIDYCGVDILRDETGQTMVLEVNGIPAWRGVQSVTDFNIAEALVADFLSRKTQRAALEAVR